MSRKVVNKGGIGVGAPYDFPGYEYDPVNDSFKDLETGKTFTKNGNAKLEASKSVTVSENGPQIVTPSPTYDGMEKVVLDVQVPAGADLEANKAATIDVSAYTEPVEITPTAGKDGMAKATVTLDNIPSGGSLRLYRFLILSYGYNDHYPYWGASQEPEVGDIIAGSGYEEASLERRYPVLAVKTVAELKASSSDWANFFNNNPGYDDASKCYSYDNEYGNYFILATDNPDFTPSEISPAYIDF